MSLDSRTVQPGDLYAALPGFVAHGGAFVGRRSTAGAVAVLTDARGAELAEGGSVPVSWSRPAGRARRRSRPRLRPARPATSRSRDHRHQRQDHDRLPRRGRPPRAGQPTGLLGTVETRVGDDLVIKSVRTTPEATDLQALFAVMREAGVAAVAMEVSSHALALAPGRRRRLRRGRSSPTSRRTTWTSTTTMEDYFAAKALAVHPGAVAGAVVCVDDEWGARLAARSGVPVSPRLHLGSPSRLGGPSPATGRHFTPAGPGGDRRSRSSAALPGDFNVANTALAAACLLELGHPLDRVARRCVTTAACPAGWRSSPRPSRPRPGPALHRRLRAHPGRGDRALRRVRPSTPGRCSWSWAPAATATAASGPAMGAAAARRADAVIVTDDNPRSEEPAAIRAAGPVRAGPAVAPAGSAAPWWPGARRSRRSRPARAPAGPPRREHRPRPRQGRRDRSGDRRSRARF